MEEGKRRQVYCLVSLSMLFSIIKHAVFDIKEVYLRMQGSIPENARKYS